MSVILNDQPSASRQRLEEIRAKLRGTPNFADPYQSQAHNSVVAVLLKKPKETFNMQEYDFLNGIRDRTTPLSDKQQTWLNRIAKRQMKF
jgi:hypothetical protein